MKRIILACLLSSALAAAAQRPTTWRFDNIQRIGGNPVTVVGTPKVISTDIGKAVHFEGKGDIGDALYIDSIPLTGALPYTWEVIFRPSSQGTPQQRFFHLQEAGSESRRLFEIRIVQGKWCLDSFAGKADAAVDPAHSTFILKCDADHLFPLDHWYAVAAVYDGKVFRNYVNGIQQGESPVDLVPLGKGGVSIGTRYNKKDFFTGDVFSARFSTRALPPSEFLKVPTPH